ncbi:MAG: hypothetical protein H7235_07945 [Bdellovibrionaceae bacterium]|nr:hypothetical protein [Pseudobdellovibrionaceae bacterium]
MQKKNLDSIKPYNRSWTLQVEKIFTIIAGPNGSGKTTYFTKNEDLNSLPFVNADIIAKEKFKTIGQTESIQAQQLAQKNIKELFAANTSFCFETVFSHTSKLDLILEAQSLGYKVMLIIVFTGNSAINVDRVRKRVAEGGHDVPIDKILSRIPKTMKNLKQAISVADGYVVIDTERKAREIVRKNFSGQAVVATQDKFVPAWVTTLTDIQSKIR